jgi:hypothetical protein
MRSGTVTGEFKKVELAEEQKSEVREQRSEVRSKDLRDQRQEIGG